MRRYLRPWLLATLLLGAVGTGPVLAHDSWLQPPAAIVQVGEPAYVDLFLGNHSNEHRSYRIAAKADPKSTVLKIFQPDGTILDATATLVDYGEADDVSPAGIKGYLGGTFTPAREGLYLAVAFGDTVLSHGGGPTFRSLRTAKTYLAAVEESLSHAKAGQGWDRVVAPEAAELVPLANPVLWKAGDTVRFQLRLKGAPLAGEKVVLIRRATSEYWEATTDANGVVSFTLPAADYYLARVKFDREQEAVEGQYSRTTYEATLTFIARARAL